MNSKYNEEMNKRKPAKGVNTLATANVSAKRRFIVKSNPTQATVIGRGNED